MLCGFSRCGEEAGLQIRRREKKLSHAQLSDKSYQQTFETSGSNSNIINENNDK